MTVSDALLLTPPAVPVMVTLVGAETALVETVKGRLVLPAETVTLAGTVAAAALLLVSATTAPPEGAALDSLTVPETELPPVTLDDESDTDESAGPEAAPGVTVSTAAHETFSSANTFACVVVLTLLVPMLKVALVPPAGMSTLEGTTAGLTADSSTFAPPVGAGALMVTLPVDGVPAVTVVGFRTSDVTQRSTAGFIVTLALTLDEPYDAVIVPVVVD